MHAHNTHLKEDNLSILHQHSFKIEKIGSSSRHPAQKTPQYDH